MKLWKQLQIVNKHLEPEEIWFNISSAYIGLKTGMQASKYLELIHETIVSGSCAILLFETQVSKIVSSFSNKSHEVMSRLMAPISKQPLLKTLKILNLLHKHWVNELRLSVHMYKWFIQLLFVQYIICAST